MGERIFNTVFAALLCVPAAIVLLPFYLLHLVTTRRHGSFLYCGIRLGKEKKPFTIYKVRTLKSNVETILGAQLHAHDATYELWYGRFLRNSRIDELPQLINIIKGDMDFVGPRPDRPAVYESNLKYIRDYDIRFRVRPGLTGYSQFYTPHSTPKRLRVLLDNYYLKKNRTFLRKLSFIARTMVQFIIEIGRELWHEIVETIGHAYHGKTLQDRRRFRRKKIVKAQCDVSRVNGTVKEAVSGTLIDINNESMLVEVPSYDIGIHDSVLIAVTYAYRKRNKLKKETIRCMGKVITERKNGTKNGKKMVVDIQSLSEQDAYKKDKYLLRSSYGR